MGGRTCNRDLIVTDQFTKPREPGERKAMGRAQQVGQDVQGDIVGRGEEDANYC
jgi:hypothetical protein